MTDLVWLAGYFEGEGTISITSSGRRGYTRPWVCLTSTDLATVRLFDDRWPGYIRSWQPAVRARVAHTWHLTSRPRAREFLIDLWPHWQTERVRAKAALLLEDIDARVQGIKDPAYLVACRERRERMRALNLRGVA
jgi:hypothetical protein